MDLAEITYQKREQIKEICKKYGATGVRVFGSVARGDFKKDSDIDLLVNVDSTGLQGFRYFTLLDELACELEKLLGCHVDVVDEVGLRDSIRPYVLKEAIPL